MMALPTVRLPIRFSLAVTLFAAVGTVSAGTYEFETFDAPGAVGSTYAEGINSLGEVVGTDGDRFFLYVDGDFSFFDIPLPPDSQGEWLSAINSRRQIVGTYYTPAGLHGFLYEDGEFATIDVPIAVPIPSGGTDVLAINDAGRYAGSYEGLGFHRGFVATGSVVTDIDLPGVDNTTITGLNNRGDVVGTSFYAGTVSFRRRNGTFTYLEHPDAKPGLTSVSGINDGGQIIGYFRNSYAVSAPARGFVYDDGFYSEISVPGAADTYPEGINNRGEVVGTFFDDSGGSHGFIATPDTPPSMPSDGGGGAVDVAVLFAAAVSGIARRRRMVQAS